MPDVSSRAPSDVRLWVALDAHKLSIVAATLPAVGGTPEVIEIEHTARAIRRLVCRLGGPQGWRSVMRPARWAGSCGGCSTGWAWRAT